MKYFAYCRKSSEDKHKQVLSILSQRQELVRRFGNTSEIEIVEFLEEEKSAMKPGRTIFGNMIKRIERGEAQGIIAWAPDRLARNSVDGGHVVYLLDQGIIRDLKFATYTFENNSQGKFMLQIMFGQSKYYSDALSENVKRGIRTKVESGWWPTIAPLGYRNDKETQTISVDEKRYPLIRRMFDMLLTGAYGAEQILAATREWGLRTPLRRKLGGRPLALSTVYKIFYNPFYAGIIQWNGKWHTGKHKAMISLAEHHRVQAILRRPGRPQPQKHAFAYTGLIRCGSCGFVVTAEKKINRFGTHYVYYHCSWRARPKCPERSVEVKNLEAQMRAFLAELSLNDNVHDWTLKALAKFAATDIEGSAAQRKALETAIANVERQSDQLTDMRVRSLIEDKEFLAKREVAQRELLTLQQSLVEFDDSQDAWFEPAKAVISFSKRAVLWFDDGTDEEKRLIVHAVCSNLSLSGKILSIQARAIYRHVPKLPTIPNLREYIQNISKLKGDSNMAESFTAIRKLEELRALRGADACARCVDPVSASSASDTDRASARLPRARRLRRSPRHIRFDRVA